jgi:cell division protein FtsL
LDDSHTFVKAYPSDEAGYSRQRIGGAYGESFAHTARPAEPAPTLSYGETIRISPKLDSEDLMPSVRKEAPAVKSEETPRIKLEQKTRTMLVVYVVAAVVLAIVVLATGLAISGAAADAAEIQGRVDALNAQLLSQQAEIGDLSDPEVIGKKAEERLGMGPIGDNVATIERAGAVEPVTYEERTNLFDKICDFLSGLFG